MSDVRIPRRGFGLAIDMAVFGDEARIATIDLMEHLA